MPYLQATVLSCVSLISLAPCGDTDGQYSRPAVDFYPGLAWARSNLR